ncbi:uncharacterized protein YjdB, partial [Filimonas zeae]|uniref:beta strand repeat-containing protein n=1 Tax=Filimonas zeae TaxID=1737353 RepID=UPI00285997FE
MPVFVLFCVAGDAIGQTNGYIYVHLRALNEESSVDFPFTITGGSTTIPSFSLNDQPAILGSVTDLGVGHGVSAAVPGGGDGELWVVMDNARIYRRRAASSQWQAITATGSVRAIDGAGPGTCVYVNWDGNAYYYNGTSSQLIYAFTGSGTNNSRAVDISYGNGRIAIARENGTIYTNQSTNPASYTDAWNNRSITGTATALDILPSDGTIVYYNSGDANAYKVAFGLGLAYTIGRPNSTDVCFDDNGNVYSNGYRYNNVGTSWSTDATRGTSFNRCTGGAGGQVWSNQTIANTAGSIFTRVPSNGLWIDDERVRTSYADNSILIPVAAGTYTLNVPNVATWDLGGVDVYDPTNNSTYSVANKTVTTNVASGEVVHVVLYENKLISLSIAKNCTESSVEDFGTGASVPSNVTSYHYLNRTRLEDGYYSIQKSTGGWENSTLTDHTTGTGNFMIVNASYQPDEFYRKRLVNLEIGQPYIMTFYVANLSPTAGLLPNVTAAVADIDGTIKSSMSTGNVTSSGWTRYTFNFTASSTTHDVYLKNNANGGGGNDLALDDISISPLTGTIDDNTIEGNADRLKLCRGTNYTFLNSAPGGVWTITSGTNVASINSSTGVLTGNNTGSATVRYEVTSSVGCKANTSTVVQVIVAPTASVTASSPVCIGNDVNLTATASSGTAPLSYSWSASSTDAGLNNSSTLSTSATPTASGTYTYALNVSDANGCTGSGTRSVTVNPLPAASISYSSPSFCATGTTNVTRTGASGGRYTSTTGLSINATSGQINLGNSSPGDYEITYTVTANSCTSTATTNVTIIGYPATSSISAPVNAVCEGNTIQLSHATPDGTWSSNNNSYATVDANGVVTGISTGSTTTNSRTVTISYVYGNGSCTRSATTNITVRRMPDAGSFTRDYEVCVGSNTTIPSPSSGGSWSSGNTSIATVNTSGRVTGVAVGETTISYTINNSGCIDVATTTVTVNASTVGAITGVTDLCVGSTSQLSNSVPGGIWTNTNSNIATVDANGLVTARGRGQAEVRYTAACGNNFRTVTIRVGDMNTRAITTNNNTSFCVGDNIWLTSNSNYGGTWSSDDASIAAVNSNGQVTGNNPGTVNINFNANDNGCLSTTSREVTVNAIPVVSAISGNVNLCKYATTTLTGNPAGGTWSGTNSNIASIHPTTGLVTAGGGIGHAVITYTYSNGGCSRSVQTNVYVNEPSSNVGTINGGNAVCAGGFIQLSSTGNSGTWSSSDNSMATVTSNGGVTAAANASGQVTIYYSVTNGSCTSSATKTITISQAPSATISYSGSPFCATGTALPTVTGTAGGTFSAASGLSISSSTGEINLAASTAGTYTITYTLNTSGCTSSTTTSVVVRALPVVPAITPAVASVCVNSYVLLSNSTAGGSWSSDNINTATVDATGNVRGIATGTATITYTVVSNGCTRTTTRNVTVNALPTATISYSGSPFCATGRVSVTRTGNTNGSYSSTSGLSLNSTTGEINLGASAAGNYRISYSFTDENTGCSNITYTDIVVNALPGMSKTSGGREVCVGSTITLTNSSTINGVSGAWSSSDVNIATVANNGVVRGVNTGNVVIAYTLTNDKGCVSQDTARVAVNALPQMVKTTGSRVVCAGSAITLSNATAGGTGVWSSSATGVATVDNNGVVRGVGAGNVVITYTVTTGSGCVSQDTARITVNALPQMVKTAGPREVCAGSTITLSNASTGGTGVWSSNAAGTATVDNNGVVRGVGAGNAVVSYTVTTGSGCISQDTARITVNALPQMV